MSEIRRLYVRKKAGFRQGEESLTAELKEVLGDRIEGCGIYHRYDVDGLSEDDYEKAVSTVFSEPPVDSVETELPRVISSSASNSCRGSMTRERTRRSSASRSSQEKMARVYVVRWSIPLMDISQKATARRS